MNFEVIFRAKLADYIKMITSKINKISNFGVVTKLINFGSLTPYDKYLFFELFKKNDIIRKEIEDILQKST